MRDGSSRAGHESTRSDPCDMGGDFVRGGLARRDQDQWTEVRRRLAARSSANRLSCQDVP
jgi:hypothetical protein